MSDDFSLLFQFLDRVGDEVQGRGDRSLDAEKTALIERFIAGGCSEKDRRELSEFLQLHPAWIRWIADRVQATRERTDDPSAQAEGDGRMTA